MYGILSILSTRIERLNDSLVERENYCKKVSEYVQLSSKRRMIGLIL